MNVCKMNAKRKAFVVAARQTFGPDKSTITGPEIYAVLEDNSGMTFPQWVVGSDFRTDNRGMFHLHPENGRFLVVKEVPV